MSDLIRREDVIEEYIVSFGLTIEDIERIPAVDAESRKHGRWTHVSDSEPYDEYVCSICGTKASSFIGGTEMWYCLLKPNYCPNCGADMREGDTE